MGRRLRRFLRENGLAIALFACFAASLIGQVAAGRAELNEEQRKHGAVALTTVEYLRSAHFREALFENWESEFLQMGAFVLMTIVLVQKGSSESKPLRGEAHARPDRLPRDAPWPVRRGGWVLAIYRHSLTLALLVLFAASFIGHAFSGAAEENRERALHRGEPVTVGEYVHSPRFWFESFQNWQSEFLSVGVLIVLSIFLRQEGSPQSKEVWEPHRKTGTD